MSKHSDSSPLLSFIKISLVYVTGPFLGLVLFLFANKGLEISPTSVAPLVWALIGYVAGQHFVNSFNEDAKRDLLKSQIDQLSMQIIQTSNAFEAKMLSAFRVSHI